MSTVIRLLTMVSGRVTPLDGQWLVEYDPGRAGVLPDGTPMRAHLVCTADPAQALRFDSAQQAFAYVRRPTGLVLPGGAADRPITAYTLLFEPSEESTR